MGKVYLVGAGCGNADLITVKGKRCIEEADCIIYDRLIDPELLSYAKANCRLIYVGKENRHHTMVQEDINQLLVEASKQYPLTVRLKGGDPYVFGRGGEEAIALYNAKVAFEEVPGITSAIGGLAYAGIPVTHRGYTNGFRVYTAHSRKNELANLDFQELARTNDTLIFLMGLSSTMEIVRRLIEHGKAQTTPIAICSHASMPSQQVLTTTLQDLQKTAVEKLSSPAIIVVGEVVKLRDTLAFFEKKPLFGKRYLLMKVQKQPHRAALRIREEGAQCDEVACGYCKVLSHDWTKEALQTCTHLILTSANVVHIMMKQLQMVGLDSRIFHNICICVMGEGTKQALAQYGLCADRMPEVYDSVHMAEMLKSELTASSHVILPKAVNGNTYLMETLRQFCKVTYIPLYQIEETAFTLPKVNYDGVIMTCPFSVQQYAAHEKQRDIAVYAMGKRTEQALLKEGFTNIVTLHHAQMEAFAQAIKQAETQKDT